MTHLWVVEMFDDLAGRWEPTVGVALSREDGRTELRRWRFANTDDQFRLVKYVRVDAP